MKGDRGFPGPPGTIFTQVPSKFILKAFYLY